MKKLIFSLLILTFLVQGSVWAQGNAVKLKCTITDCDGDLKVFQYNGFAFDEIALAKKINETVFEISVPKTEEPRAYFIGPDQKDVKSIILGTESNVSLEGKCSKMRVAQIKNSPLNEGMDALRQEIARLRTESIKLARKMRVVKEEEQKQEIIDNMAALDAEKMNLLDSLKADNTYYSKTVAMNTYLSFFNHGQNYRGEILYFANDYFKYVDFSDEAYNHLPWLTDEIKSFTNTLVRVGLDERSQGMFLDKIVKKAPEGSMTRQYILSGIIAVCQKEKNSNFIKFGKQYIEEYSEAQPTIANTLNQLIEQQRAFMIGGVAPDFSQNTPKGEAMKLSDLRGKVVLVDFWASWCGPCRRENPNVVRLYNQYKEQGFDILGVSLDRDKSRWLGAIEKDGLTWNHVSDLKGWQNAVAKMYNVSSIPQTLLIDQEGRILAKNLRGPALEQKLAEIFSENEE